MENRSVRSHSSAWKCHATVCERGVNVLNGREERERGANASTAPATEWKRDQGVNGEELHLRSDAQHCSGLPL